MVSDQDCHLQVVLQGNVLILVLMEYGLGRWSALGGGGEPRVVLILVLMEYGLGRGVTW